MTAVAPAPLPDVDTRMPLVEEREYGVWNPVTDPARLTTILEGFCPYCIPAERIVICTDPACPAEGTLRCPADVHYRLRR